MADEEQERLLQQILQSLNASGGRNDSPDMEKAKKSLQKFVSETNKGVNQEGKRQSLVSKGMRTTNKAVQGALNVAKSLESASTAMRENRESFSSLNPTIDLAGAAISGMGKLTGAAAEAMGGLLGAIPLVGTGLGGAVKGLGKFASAAADMAATIVTKVGPMFTAELDRISTAFRTAAASGAVGADGMSGLAKNAINAGLSFDSFAKTMSKEANNLTFAFGTSADAAKGLADTSKAMRPFRQNLMNLGVGVEQQNELTAKYIVYQQRMGRNEIGNSRALAAGSKNYIKNLSELSRLTGKSIDETQKGIDATMSDVRAGASIRLIEKRLGGERGKDAARQAQGVIEFMRTTKGLEKTAEGFGDALSGNSGTEAAKQFELQFGTAGKEVVQLMKSGQITRDEALTRLQKASNENYNKVGGDEFASRVGKMGTVLEGVLPGFQAFNQLKDFGAVSGKAAQQTTALMNTQDGLTKQIVGAQESMIKTATELDKFALAVTLPAAAATIEGFVDIQLKMTKKMVEYAQIMQVDGIDGLAKALKADAKGAITDKLGSKNNDATVEAQDAANKKLMTPFERVNTALAEGLEYLVGGFSKNAENFLQAARVENQTQGAIDEGRMKKSGVVQGYKLQARATGGAAEAGKEYLVGENGPELLKMGKTGGVVIPGQVGPGVPGRTPGTFDVKLGDGTKVTVDAKGNELHRSTPTLGGLTMSSFADGSVSGQYNTTVGNVNMTRDYVGGAGVSGDGMGGMREAGLGLASGPFSTYQSGKAGANEGVASMSYGIGNGQTMSMQSGARGGQFDALGQLRSTAGPSSKLGDAGGIQLDTEAMNQGGPPGERSEVMHGAGAGNEKLLAVMQAMLDQQTKGTRLQDEQLQATRNN